jgi:hypothetical protein
MPSPEQDHLTEKVEEAVDDKQQSRRRAWRGMLIPAVGSAAFGWSDYALMSIPFVILGLALTEEIKEAQ